MNSNREILKSGLKKSMMDEWKNECHQKDKREVCIFDKNMLAERIYGLPEDLKALLFMKEIYNIGPRETERILDIENAADKYKFAELLLALSMNLSENQKISEESLKDASKIAFMKYINDEETDISKDIILSFKQRRRLEDMGINTHSKNKSVIKKAVIVVLASVLSLGLAISVNAELREEIYRWIVKTFPKYSSFAIENQSSADVDFKVLENIKFNYLPEKLSLTEKNVADPVAVYQFENEDKFIYLHARTVNNTVNLDTEGIDIEEIMIGDKKAYTWRKGNEIYVTFEKYNIGFTVISNLSPKNIIEFCENIFI